MPGQLGRISGEKDHRNRDPHLDPIDEMIEMIRMHEAAAHKQGVHSRRHGLSRDGRALFGREIVRVEEHPIAAAARAEPALNGAEDRAVHLGSRLFPKRLHGRCKRLVKLPRVLAPGLGSDRASSAAPSGLGRGFLE